MHRRSLRPAPPLLQKTEHSVTPHRRAAPRLPLFYWQWEQPSHKLPDVPGSTSGFLPPTKSASLARCLSAQMRLGAWLVRDREAGLRLQGGRSTLLSPHPWRSGWCYDLLRPSLAPGHNSDQDSSLLNVRKLPSSASDQIHAAGSLCWHTRPFPALPYTEGPG